jgi:predicted nucleotidyltransferase
MQRDEALRIISEHEEEIRGFGVERLAIFGSVARDDAGPESDVDILVEFGDRPVGLFGLSRLRRYLEDVLERPVDLVTPDALKRQLKERILEESVRVA